MANQASPSSPAGLEDALEKGEAVEEKVQDASDKLSVVNLALKDEIKERHALEDKLVSVTEQGKADRRAALHDSLTDLPNRTLFYDRLEHAFLQAKRHGWTLAVMFVDLDEFKTINDRHGHEAGDKILQVIAERLKQGTRGDDTVSRRGGDEIDILINEVRPETDISLIAKKILATIQVPCEIQAPSNNRAERRDHDSEHPGKYGDRPLPDAWRHCRFVDRWSRCGNVRGKAHKVWVFIRSVNPAVPSIIQAASENFFRVPDTGVYFAKSTCRCFE